MSACTVRVRFAPSPTGFMHLGNVRAALMNYLFARHHQGTFILRIEDTDVQRNMYEAEQKIFTDLVWLGLTYDEGPGIGGRYAPYAQSERAHMYQQYLEELLDASKIYRCFCSAEELERKRERQIALKKPPRYDRTCLHLSDDKIKAKIAFGTPFIFRLIINQQQQIAIRDLAHGAITFDMVNFSDFALTRPDGSFTFLFANFVDDWQMKITHVIRGDDHLSNTALQAALYDAFAVPLPTFWHLPMICNHEGKKLSKRDFGFSLDDLVKGGFIAPAITNYLATIAGTIVAASEVQNLEELTHSFDFNKLHASSAVHYDLDKLTWFNHQWLMRMTADELYVILEPLLKEVYGSIVESYGRDRLVAAIGMIKTDLKKTIDIIELLKYCFIDPIVDEDALAGQFGVSVVAAVRQVLKDHKDQIDDPEAFVAAIKSEAQKHNIAAKPLWGIIRTLLTGSASGMGIKDLCTLLSKQQRRARLLPK